MNLMHQNVFLRSVNNYSISRLFSPRVYNINSFKLPKNSVYHYLDSQTHKEFPTDIHLLRSDNNSRKIPISFQTDLVSKLGDPLTLNANIKNRIMNWYVGHRDDFRLFENVDEVGFDTSTNHLISYGLADSKYRYRSNILSEYYRWFNLEKTRMTRISEDLTQEGVLHFIEYRIPDLLPSYSLLTKLPNYPESSVYRALKSPSMFFIYHLFMMFDNKHIDRSIFADFKGKDLNNFIILLRKDDYFTTLNLGILYSSLESSIKTKKKVYDTPTVQRILLKFLNVFVTTVEEKLEDEAVEEEIHEPGYDEETDDPEPSKLETSEDEDDPELNGLLPKGKVPPPVFKPNKDKIDDNPEDLNFVKDIDLDELDDAGVSDLDIELIKDIEKEEDVPEVIDEAYFESIDDDIEIKNEVSDTFIDDNISQLDSLYKLGYINKAEHKKSVKDMRESKTKPSAYNYKETVEEFIDLSKVNKAITSEGSDLKAKDSVLYNNIMTKSSLKEFDSKYVKDIMPKHITAMIYKLEDFGLTVQDHQIEEDKNSIHHYEIHRLSVKPVSGAASTIVFKIPKIDRDGYFISDGVKLRMRKQKTDMPIRKINASRVALSSYYGKLFMFRTPRKAYSETAFILSSIKKMMLEPGYLKKAYIEDVSFKEKTLPLHYYSISTNFSKLEFDGFTLYFNCSKMSQWATDAEIKDAESKGYIPVGRTDKKTLIVINQHNMFFGMTNGTFTELGDIHLILKTPTENIPIDYTEVKLLGKDIPLGIILGRYLGLRNLIKLLKVKPKVIPTNKRYTLTKDEWLLRFKDYKLVFSRRDDEANLILAGFTYFKDYIKTFTISEMNDRDTYASLIENRGFTTVYVKEMDVIRKMFIDPITKDILADMKEPQEFIPLLIRANELLTTNEHPDMNDMSHMRIRGYERVPGFIYKNLVKSAKTFNLKNVRGKSKIELNPYDIFNSVVKDHAAKIAEDINPITNLKEQEAVTYVGEDGISKEVINVKLRSYHKKEMGIISEATVDSSDVAINTFLTTDPMFKDLYGISKDSPVKDPFKLLSTSAALVPGVNNDDPKRTNFINIQNAHTIATEGYHQPLLRTGYEYLVPYRTGEMFAYMAQQDGKVIERTDKIIHIEYIDKSRVGLKIGNRFGMAEGVTYLHPIVCDLSTGQSFKEGDVVIYNSSFFERDWLDPSKIILKFSTTARTVFMEGPDTYEDSSAISNKMADKLTTTKIEVKKYPITFDKKIRDLIPVGAEIEPGDAFFVLEDAAISDNPDIDMQISKTLEKLSNISPKSKVRGKILKYEVKYNGDIEDMSPSLRKLVNELNKTLESETQHTPEYYHDNQVTGDYRVDGKNLQVDTLILKIYITIPLRTGVGDKGVFGPQMKSVFGEVLDYDLKTLDGQEIDAIFSFMGIMKRVVISPLLNGAANTVLKAKSKTIADIYFK